MDSRRLTWALNAPVDGASLAVFRAAFGCLMVATTLRFWGRGWVEREFTVPTHFFPYWGFGWVRPLPGLGMHVVYALMLLAAAGIALGFAYRLSAGVFFLSFTYAHLCDKTNYLNHYYLVSLLALGLCVAPLDRLFSLRIRARPQDRSDQVRCWILFLFRFQVAVVYLFGGIAKLGSDWLVHGEPLRVWLSTRRDLPFLGHWFALPQMAIAFSWCGMLFDLSVVPLLLWPRTRKVAYGVAVVFHAMTAVLFNVGMFPWIMVIAATVLLDPAWPRRLGDRLGKWTSPTGPTVGVSLNALGTCALAVYVLVQIGLPLRHFFYPGNTLWTEEGFRFAWKVMLIEKQGDLELTVVEPGGRRTQVSPRQYLTPFQVKMASTQPDMVLQLAHRVASDWDARGKGPVAIYADAQVTFNGRSHQPMIDPTANLALERDTLLPKPWILPAPTAMPRF